MSVHLKVLLDTFSHTFIITLSFIIIIKFFFLFLQISWNLCPRSRLSIFQSFRLSVFHCRFKTMSRKVIGSHFISHSVYFNTELCHGTWGLLDTGTALRAQWLSQEASGNGITVQCGQTLSQSLLLHISYYPKYASHAHATRLQWPRMRLAN